MKHDIEKVVKTCRSCALAAKSLPVKFQPWPRLYTDYAGPLNGSYYLVVVDSYTKWP